MLLRAYSILGTLLLALSVASPALAAGKGKKKANDSAEAAKEGDEAKADSDDGADDKKAAKRNKKKKKGKKADEEAEAEKAEEEKAAAESASAGESDTTAVTAEAADTNVWEKPPEEKEKPKPADTPAPVVEKGDNRPISIGIAAGYALKLDRATGGLAADPYGLGAGLRGGYELDFKLYLGVYFMWYLGSSTSGSTQRIMNSVRETHANYWQFGIDVGYDWWVADIIIRPSMELGMGIAVTDATGRTTSVSDFMFGPGITVIYPWDNLFIGGELRGNVVTGNGVAGLLIAAQFGMRFEG